jgi:hypothetical protein
MYKNNNTVPVPEWLAQDIRCRVKGVKNMLGPLPQRQSDKWGGVSSNYIMLMIW